MKKKVLKTVTGTVKTFIFPIAVWLVVAVLTLLAGKMQYFTIDALGDILRASVLTTIVALAIALPLSGGRWDFAVGANMVLTAIIACNLAIQFNVGLFVLILLCIAVAVVLALFEALLYILFKIPNMIISLGIVMLYEALSGMVFNGGGVRLFMYDNLAVLARSPWCFIVLAIVGVLFWFLMKYTKFGYDSKSLGANALLSISAGVKEKKNIVLTYIAVGVLLGIAALINASKAVVAPAAGLSSTNLMFASMGPVLIGLFLSRYSNMPLGIFAGSFAMESLSKGFSVYGLNSAFNTIILGVFILLFMGYTTNMAKIHGAISRIFKKSKEKQNAQ